MNLSLEEFPPSTYEEWRHAAEESLKGAPFDKKLITPTPEGIKLQPIYSKEDLAALELPESWPGLPPFMRGSAAAGFKAKPWLIAQERRQPGPGLRKRERIEVLLAVDRLELDALRRCGDQLLVKRSAFQRLLGGVAPLIIRCCGEFIEGQVHGNAECGVRSGE